MRNAEHEVAAFPPAGTVTPHRSHRMNFETVSTLFRNLEAGNFLSLRTQEQSGYLFQIAQYLFPDLRRQQIVNFLSKHAQEFERLRSRFVIMTALGQRTNFVGQYRDRFSACDVELI